MSVSGQTKYATNQKGTIPMKKVSAILLALALVFSLAVFASADPAADLNEVIAILSENADEADVKAAINDALAVAGVKADADAEDVSDVQAASVADTIIDKFNLSEDAAAKVQKAMSNDFVAFLTGIYTGKVTKPAPTGSSPVIAIAAFATLSVAAAAAFVTMKKKED